MSENFPEAPYLPTDGDRLDARYRRRSEQLKCRDTLPQRRARVRDDADECGHRPEFDQVVRFLEDRFAERWWTDNGVDHVYIPFYSTEFNRLAALVEEVNATFEAGCGAGFHEAVTEFAFALSGFMAVSLSEVTEHASEPCMEEDVNANA